MYQVDDNDNVAYTRYQLQKILPNEVKPPLQREQYAQEIVSKRKVKGLIYYSVRWEDNEITEMDGKQAREQIPDLIKEFNDKNNNKKKKKSKAKKKKNSI
jgi:hypothetical protein